MSQSNKKEQLAILKKRLGVVPEALLQELKENKKIKKAIKASLKGTESNPDNGKTIPEISKESGFSTEIINWHLASMRKYGFAVESPKKKGKYYKWALVGDN